MRVCFPKKRRTPGTERAACMGGRGDTGGRNNVLGSSLFKTVFPLGTWRAATSASQAYPGAELVSAGPLLHPTAAGHAPSPPAGALAAGSSDPAAGGAAAAAGAGSSDPAAGSAAEGVEHAVLSALQRLQCTVDSLQEANRNLQLGMAAVLTGGSSSGAALAPATALPAGSLDAAGAGVFVTIPHLLQEQQQTGVSLAGSTGAVPAVCTLPTKMSALRSVLMVSEEQHWAVEHRYQHVL